MAILRSLNIQNLLQFLPLCIWIFFFLIDFVNAQSATSKPSSGTSTRYYIIFIPGGALAGVAIRKCCCYGKSNDEDTVAAPTSPTPAQSRRTEPICLARPTMTGTRHPTITAQRLIYSGTVGRPGSTSVTPISSTAAAAQTNISAETFMAERMRERQNVNRDRIYSIPIESDERHADPKYVNDEENPPSYYSLFSSKQ